MAIKEQTITNPETARAVEEYLVEVGKRMAEAQAIPHQIDVLGKTYIYHDGRLERVYEELPPDNPEPGAIETFSLVGLVDLIKADVEGVFEKGKPPHIVQVVNPQVVTVYSPASGNHAKRYVRITCHAPLPSIRFGSHMETEDFQVMMQTCFIKSEARDLVMKLAGSVSREQSMRKSDDGMTQTLQVQTGVVTVGDVTLKNPVPLTPIRTFFEVEQVETPFVLRFDENGLPALHDGDGGAWKVEAVTRIARWLREHLKGCNVAVIG